MFITVHMYNLAYGNIQQMYNKWLDLESCGKKIISKFFSFFIWELLI